MKLSIIIPIYNSDKYLAECLNSICKQIKDNSISEIILINDHSKDTSLNICKLFVKKFSFIKLINLKKNKGVSNARNKGLGIALGEYIIFIDSDDKLQIGSINIILNKIKKFKGKDLFVIRSKEINDKIIDKNQFLELGSSKNKKSILSYIHNFNRFRATCWNFIIKRDFINLHKIKFKNITTFEDQVFVSEILCLSKKFEIINKPMYLWRIFEPNTLGKKSGFVVAISCLKIIFEIIEFIHNNKIHINKIKVKFLISRLNYALNQFFLHLTICDKNELKKISFYLIKNKLVFFKLRKINYKKLNFLIKNNINHNINDLQRNTHKILLKKIFKNKSKNFILFCAGGYGSVVLTTYNIFGIKIKFIVDNNLRYSGKKLLNTKIQSPTYLSKNFRKIINYEILVCNPNSKIYKDISAQLNKIGFKQNQISHIKF